MQKEVVLRFGKKRLYKLGGSKGLLIPMEVLKFWKLSREDAKDIEEVEIVFTPSDNCLRIYPAESEKA